MQSYKITELDGTVTEHSRPVCYSFARTIETKYLNQVSIGALLPYAVVLFATVVRLMLIMIAKTIRFRNRTSETIYILLCILWINVFTYGAVYLMAPWDARNTNLPTFLKDFYNGLHTDFNAYWFNEVGVIIVSTMMFNAIYPPIEFLGYWALRIFFRGID